MWVHRTSFMTKGVHMLVGWSVVMIIVAIVIIFVERRLFNFFDSHGKLDNKVPKGLVFLSYIPAAVLSIGNGVLLIVPKKPPYGGIFFGARIDDMLISTQVFFFLVAIVMLGRDLYKWRKLKTEDSQWYNDRIAQVQPYKKED